MRAPRTEQPRPHPEATIDFLKKWAPDGPWVLTAIFAERKGTATATFRPDDEAELRAWLVKHELCNCYFHVNPTTHDLTKKAERTDISALAWLHVDIDPRAGEDLEAERERALKLLRQPPGDLPPPTCPHAHWGASIPCRHISRNAPQISMPRKGPRSIRAGAGIDVLIGGRASRALGGEFDAAPRADCPRATRGTPNLQGVVGS